jgi:ribosomal protein S8E
MFMLESKTQTALSRVWREGKGGEENTNTIPAIEKNPASPIITKRNILDEASMLSASLAIPVDKMVEGRRCEQSVTPSGLSLRRVTCARASPKF